jgi:hypothetical protein
LHEVAHGSPSYQRYVSHDPAVPFPRKATARAAPTSPPPPERAAVAAARRRAEVMR